MAKQLYEAIRTAQKSVVIVTPYFVVIPEQELLFKELRARNIRIRVFTNSKSSNEVPLAHLGYLKTRDLALKHGVQIWEYNGPDTLHAKMVLIDRNTMFIGSFNWDFRSQNLNRENGIIAHINDDSQFKTEETDIFAKIARIYQRSTRIGDSQHLNPDIGDDGEFDDDDISKLARQNKNGNSDLFWRIIYPLVKKQI
ncbi:MAG: phospholipase D-like domain-containing protein [Pseudobdellovibrio sp.]